MRCTLGMHTGVKAEVGVVAAEVTPSSTLSCISQSGHLSWKIKINGIDKPMGVG